MDRRHIEWQIRAVVVTYRVERRRRDALTMEAFRARARLILDGLDAQVSAHPDLTDRLRAARQELDLIDAPAAKRHERDAASHG